jgi:ribosomal protein L11 methyltransferase
VEEERGRTFVEYAIYGPPGELPELPELRAAAGEGLVEIETTEIPDDWADSWRDFHHPVLVGERLVVRPSWEPRLDAGDEARLEVVIDPGRAFGTGGHATTRMCLEMLVELADSGAAAGAIADWGTGSGVLAIAAAKLGFDPVCACDSEPAAIDAARANARLNGVEIDLRRANLREEVPPTAATAVANLTAPILLSIASLLEDPPQTLVCSGLLAAEAAEVAAAFASHGLDQRGRLAEGDWAALLVVRA